MLIYLLLIIGILLIFLVILSSKMVWQNYLKQAKLSDEILDLYEKDAKKNLELIQKNFLEMRSVSDMFSKSDQRFKKNKINNP